MSETAQEKKEEKEPWSFTEYFDKTFQAIKERIENRRAVQVENERLRIARLREIVAKGARASEFLKSDILNKDLLPFLREGAEKAMKPWSPGDPLDCVNETYFYSSGVANTYLKLMAKIRAWVEEGEHAQRELAYELERQRKEEAFRGKRA